MEQIIVTEVEADGVVYRLVVDAVDRSVFAAGGAEQIALVSRVIATPVQTEA